MEQMRIVKEQRAESEKQLIASEGENFDRANIKPRYMVWENVCFIADTQIMTINGLKAIQDIQVGDQVLTHNHRYMPVVETYVHTDKEVVRVNIIGETPLICTPNHPIYGCKKNSDGSYGELEFISAGLLTSEHRVASFWNDKIAYKAIESVVPLNKKETVYNLSVLEDNTYVANGIICHNCGAFSSGTPGGSDFQAVLEEICKIVRHDCPVVPIPKDGWPSAGNLDGVGDDGTPFSICWRLHDAQYWGVPQRRRRIALVADFGGSSAPEILLEPYSLQGHSKQSSKEGQGVARDTSSSVGETSSGSSTEQSRGSGERGIKESSKVYGICSFDSNAMKSDNPESGIYEADSARTLDLNGGNPACNQGGMAVVQGADVYNGDVTGDVAPSVTTKTGEPGSSGPKVIESSDKCLNSWDVQSKHIQPEDGIAESLYSGECRYGGGESYVLQNQKEPVLLESSQNHATVQTDGVSTTLPAAMGEGGGYVPMVCIEGNGSRDSHKGDGYSESETMYTLNTVEQHAVAYGVTTKGNGDAFINPNTHTSLATGGGEPGQGYPCVLTTENAPETYQKTTGALMASGYSKLGTQEAANDMYVVQQPFVQSMELFHCTTEEELAAPLKARDYKDPQVVAFEPGAASRVGGHVYEDDKAGTLRAEMGDNQQAIVQSAGFCTEHSAKAHSIGYQAECAPTLREGTVPATIYESKAVESHAQDARYNVGDVNQTLGANMEHDAANGGLVYDVDYNAEKSDICYGFQGQVGGSASMSVGENVSPTLVVNQVANVTQPAAFKKSSHAKSAEDGQGWEHTEVNDTLNAFDNGETRTPTLVLNDQGGQQMQVSLDQTATLRAEEHGHQPLVFDASRRHDYKPFGDVAETVQAQYGTGGNNTPMVMDMLNLNPQETEKSMTLNAYNGTGGNNMPMVFENHSQDTRYNAMGETCQTVSATWGMGGNNQPLEVKPQQAVVRRLTPLECEKLQGFPVIRTVRFTEMTKDEYIAWNICEGHIRVDFNTGKVYATRGPGGVKLNTPRELKGTDLKGYLVVSIRNGDTKMQCRIHRIVWIAAHGIVPDGYVIDHINNDKSDNRLCNLQLLTGEDNSHKAKADGKYLSKENGSTAKINNAVHDLIQYVYGTTDLSIRELATYFGISRSRIQQIIHEEPWTDIGDWVDSKGKKHKGDSDSPRYKALGNSIALPFWDWMAGRMVEQLRNSGVENPTLASLFDGIGGFPLVYSKHGCDTLWASEIEEYCVALTKKRFGGETTLGVDHVGQYSQPYTPMHDDIATSNLSGDGVANTPISFDRAAFNQGANAKYDFAIEDNDKAQTIVARGPGGVCQPMENEVVGSICASDYKGIRNQDIDDGKWVVPTPNE